MTVIRDYSSQRAQDVSAGMFWGFWAGLGCGVILRLVHHS